MTFGEQIKQAREAKNLSQEELAARLEVSRQAVSKWENEVAKPQGINKEMLSQILEIELCGEEVCHKKKTFQGILGWIVAAVLGIGLLVALAVLVYRKEAVVQTVPAITNITFYDEDKNPVEQEALWYNSAQIESILVQWVGGTPDNIKMFATPTGTETLDKTELLLTKSVLDGNTVELLDADPLKDKFQVHVYFQLEFGETVVTSDLYNIFYDEAWDLNEE